MSVPFIKIGKEQVEITPQWSDYLIKAAKAELDAYTSVGNNSFGIFIPLKVLGENQPALRIFPTDTQLGNIVTELGNPAVAEAWVQMSSPDMQPDSDWAAVFVEDGDEPGPDEIIIPAPAANVAPPPPLPEFPDQDKTDGGGAAKKTRRFGCFGLFVLLLTLVAFAGALAVRMYPLAFVTAAVSLTIALLRGGQSNDSKARRVSKRMKAANLALAFLGGLLFLLIVMLPGAYNGSWSVAAYGFLLYGLTIASLFVLSLLQDIRKWMRYRNTIQGKMVRAARSKQGGKTSLRRLVLLLGLVAFLGVLVMAGSLDLPLVLAVVIPLTLAALTAYMVWDHPKLFFAGLVVVVGYLLVTLGFFGDLNINRVNVGDLADELSGLLPFGNGEEKSSSEPTVPAVVPVTSTPTLEPVVPTATPTSVPTQEPTAVPTQETWPRWMTVQLPPGIALGVYVSIGANAALADIINGAEVLVEAPDTDGDGWVKITKFRFEDNETPIPGFVLSEYLSE